MSQKSLVEMAIEIVAVRVHHSIPSASIEADLLHTFQVLQKLKSAEESGHAPDTDYPSESAPCESPRLLLIDCKPPAAEIEEQPEYMIGADNTECVEESLPPEQNGRSCARCEKGELVRIQRKAWMRIIPFSKHFQCNFCASRFIAVGSRVFSFARQ